MSFKGPSDVNEIPFACHMRVYSQYAPLQGATRTEDLIKWAKDSGATHVMFSDPSSMHGAWYLQKAAQDAGLIPVHAVEIKGDVLIPTTEEGLSTVLRIVSADRGAASVETLDLSGVAVLSRKRDREFQRLVVARGGEFLVEWPVMEQEPCEAFDFAMYSRNSFVIPTVDARYAFMDQRADYMLIEAIRRQIKLADVPEDITGSHLVTSDELPRSTTLDCALMELKRFLHSHTFPLLKQDRSLWPHFENEEANLYAELKKGMSRRYPGGVSQEVKDRTRYEFDIVTSKGYASYFLLMQDLVHWCKSQGIYTNTRGSAAGSLCLYLLGVTDLDPLLHGMLFERFLNPERDSPPDVDLDVATDGRQDIIQYLRDRWGSENVTQIGSLGTFVAKSSIRDVCRVLGFSHQLANRLSEEFPPSLFGREMTLAECFDESADRYNDAESFRALVESDIEASIVVEHARRLTGLTRQTGVHAAGVIVSSRPVASVAPLMMNADGGVTSQWYWGQTEAAGLLKLDVLGLRNLQVLRSALEQIEETTGEKIDPYAIPLNDPETLEMLREGNTLGCFQIEGAGMKSLIKSMEADRFEDIPATVALYRPGPMGVNAHNIYADRKTGREAVTPLHPAVKDELNQVLGKTYGVIAYQEQVLELARLLGGYSLGAADNLRRAMGKKNHKVMEQEKIKFAEGCRLNGYPEEAVEVVWNAMEKNADYAFCHSHAMSYGWMAMAEAWLKAHYPLQFMSALLSNSEGRIASYLRECRRMGIQVFPPSVHNPSAYCRLEGNAIRMGFRVIGGVGTELADLVADVPPPAGTLIDWLSSAPDKLRNKRSLEALIKAGALSGFGHTRKGLLESTANLIAVAKLQMLAKEIGESAIPTGADITVDDRQEFDSQELLRLEKSSLGLYVTSHPLEEFGAELAKISTHSLGSIALLDDKTKVTVAGHVIDVQLKSTKSDGSPWAIVTLEDLDGSAEVLMFPKIWEPLTGIKEGALLRMEARVSCKNGSTSLMPNSVSVLSRTANRSPFVVRLPRNDNIKDALTWLSSLTCERSDLSTTLLVSVGCDVFDLGQIETSTDLTALIRLSLGPGAC